MKPAQPRAETRTDSRPQDHTGEREEERQSLFFKEYKNNLPCSISPVRSFSEQREYERAPRSRGPNSFDSRPQDRPSSNWDDSRLQDQTGEREKESNL
jgi:hypothetical protein